MIVFGDSEESYMPSEGNAQGQESFRYRILSKEMAGAHMEKERSKGKTWWEAIGRQSQSSAISNIGLRRGGLLPDAYLRKAFELDIYLVALCGK